MEQIFTAYYKSPIGCIEVTGDDYFINSLYFIEEEKNTNQELPKNIIKCMKQLDEYFNHKRKEFTLPLHFEGTDFQKNVWLELLLISYGKTLSYQALASRVGNEKAVRAVGAANGKNKISIIH